MYPMLTKYTPRGCVEWLLWAVFIIVTLIVILNGKPV